MPKTSLERVTAHRQRKKAGIEIPQCKCDAYGGRGCLRPLKGEKSQKRRLCNFCYRFTTDGRHQVWACKKENQAKPKEALQSWELCKVGEQAIAPDGSVGIVEAIALYANGNIVATVQFDGSIQDNFVINQENCLISH